MTMAKPIEKELAEIRKDVKFIRHALEEGYELSDEAKAAIEEAREAPDSEYVDL